MSNCTSPLVIFLSLKYAFIMPTCFLFFTKAEAFTIPFCIQRNTNTMGGSAVTYTGRLLTPLQMGSVSSLGQCLNEVIRYVKE